MRAQPDTLNDADYLEFTIKSYFNTGGDGVVAACETLATG